MAFIDSYLAVRSLGFGERVPELRERVPELRQRVPELRERVPELRLKMSAPPN